jgi:hypothetical protein
VRLDHKNEKTVWGKVSFPQAEYKSRHKSYNNQTNYPFQSNCQEIIRPSLTTKAKRFLGGYAEGVTPVPIPNTEVKPLRADDTARVAVWESRSPPGIICKSPATRNGCGAFTCLKTEKTGLNQHSCAGKDNG